MGALKPFSRVWLYRLCFLSLLVNGLEREQDMPIHPRPVKRFGSPWGRVVEPAHQRARWGQHVAGMVLIVVLLDTTYCMYYGVG